jgi:hypothetical protein
MYIKNGLAYFEQRPFTAKEYSTLPKIILTSEVEWVPSVLDCDEGTFEVQNPKDLTLNIMGSEFNYFDGMGRPNDIETGAFMLEISKLEREGFIREGNDDDLLDECMRLCNNRQRYPRKAKKGPPLPEEPKPITRKKKETAPSPVPIPEPVDEESSNGEEEEEYDDSDVPPPLMGRETADSSDDESDDDVSISSSILLQLMALKFSPQVWGRFQTFLRTRSRHIPSERTVKDVVSHLMLEDFLGVAPSATMQEIRDRFRADEQAVSDSIPSTEKEAA